MLPNIALYEPEEKNEEDDSIGFVARARIAAEPGSNILTQLWQTDAHVSGSYDGRLHSAD